MRRRGRARALEQAFERRVKGGDRERKPGGEEERGHVHATGTVNSTQGQTVQTIGLCVGVTALRVVLEVRSVDLCTGARVVLGDVLGRGYRKQIATHVSHRCRP